MIEAGLFNLLSTAPSIVAVCGTRIYPVTLPTGPTYPCVRYSMVSAKASPTLTTSGMQRWRIQFDCLAAKYPDAVGLRAAIMALLNGYQGVLSDGTNLQNAAFQTLVESFSDDARVFKCSVDFFLYFCFSN